MTIRMLPDGTLEFDSVDDAIEFRNRLNHVRQPRESTASHRPPQNRVVPSRTTGFGLDPGGPAPDAPRVFFNNLTENAQRVVRVLVGAGGRSGSRELAAESEIETKQLPPVMKSIRSAAERVGLSRDQIIDTDRQMTAGRAETVYRLDQSVLTFLANLFQQNGDRS